MGFALSVLPISDILDSLVTALRRAPQVILQAPPGAGKSTWLPVQLLNLLSLPGKIILLEPRRLAAKTVATRLAQQLNQLPGERVGYRLRGEQRISADTQLEVVTEGILTRMLQQDPLLEGVSMVILDEFHERSFHADLALALLLDMQQGLRDDLRILLMSATLDNQKLAQLLPDAPLISSEGRSFPVTRHYQPLASQPPFPQAVAAVVADILARKTGSLLLFLPGEREIEQVRLALIDRCDSQTDLRPLFGALPLADQQAAIAPALPGRRKVVLATNIAETSLTIDGICLVVDSALEKNSRFDGRLGGDLLQTQAISQSSLIQRAGRAGRTQPGECWHLLTAEQASRLAEQPQPEILRSDLTALLLNVLAWGCQQAHALRWVDSPPEAALQSAYRALLRLGAVDEEGRLTVFGRQIAAIGSEPRIASLLCHANLGSPEEFSSACLLAAMIESGKRSASRDLRDVFAQPAQHEVLRAKQFARRLHGSYGQVTADVLAKLLLTTYIDRVAHRRGISERYHLAQGRGVSLPIDHPLTQFEWLIVIQVQQFPAQREASILLALPISLELLRSSASQAIRLQHALSWQPEKAQFRVWQQEMIGEIVIRTLPAEKPSQAELAAAFLAWVRQKGLEVLPWDESALQLRERLRSAKHWLPALDWPAVDDTALHQQLEQWLLPELLQLPNLGKFARINLQQGLRSLLNWTQRQALEQLLPSHYVVPTGSRLPIQYRGQELPLLSVRVQEMYGQAATPTLAEGRVPLVLQLLSPAHRPIQVTQDLAGFWCGSWREVQKEMKGRYPKHLWPDDPAKASPTTRTACFSR